MIPGVSAYGAGETYTIVHGDPFTATLQTPFTGDSSPMRQE